MALVSASSNLVQPTLALGVFMRNSRIVWSSDGNKSSTKIPCPKCKTKVYFYIDGSIERHKTYFAEEKNGKLIKTNYKVYCDQREWR